MITKTVRRNTEVGTFFVGDADYLQEYGSKKISNAIDIPNGKYRVNISVKSVGGFFHSQSQMKKQGYIEIKSGKLYIGCPGEPFSDSEKYYEAWIKFLAKTDFMKKVPSTVKFINTGGDGPGEITVTLEKVGKETVGKFGVPEKMDRSWVSDRTGAKISIKSDKTINRRPYYTVIYGGGGVSGFLMTGSKRKAKTEFIRKKMGLGR